MDPDDLRALTDQYGRGTPGRKVEFDLGRRWAYRAGSQHELAEVEVLRLGVKKPARLLVRWIADEFEGRQDWVPPSRLKVPWDRVDDLRAWEARWAAVQEPAWEAPELVRDATDYVVELLIEPDIAAMGFNAQRGVIKIHQLDRLAALLGIEAAELRADPRSFEENGTLIAPIAIATAVAKSAAASGPTRCWPRLRRKKRRPGMTPCTGGPSASVAKPRTGFLARSASASIRRDNLSGIFCGNGAEPVPVQCAPRSANYAKRPSDCAP